MKKIFITFLVTATIACTKTGVETITPMAEVKSTKASAISVVSKKYYVDPTFTGTSIGTITAPFKTIAEVNSKMNTFVAGDSILFKRGTTFSNQSQLTIKQSGVSGKPIVFGAYGIGVRPVFDYKIGVAILFNNVSNVVFSGIRVTDNTAAGLTDKVTMANVKYGIILANSPNCRIEYCEFIKVGNAIALEGTSDYTTILNNTFLDLKMVRNTIGGEDDYGANGVTVGSSYNTITKNFFQDCYGQSYDFGNDGGAIEFYGNNVSNNTITYNVSKQNVGFLEAASETIGGTLINNVVAYNVMINNAGSLGVIHNQTMAQCNFNYYNNTIVETANTLHPSNSMFWMGKKVGITNSSLVVKNNIFYTLTTTQIYPTAWVGSGYLNYLDVPAIVRSNNIYRTSNSNIGAKLNNSEYSNSTILLFKNTLTHPNSWDLNLLSGCKAVNFGTNLGMIKDINGKTIVGAPDAGAYELK